MTDEACRRFVDAYRKACDDALRELARRYWLTVTEARDLVAAEGAPLPTPVVPDRSQGRPGPDAPTGLTAAERAIYDALTDAAHAGDPAPRYLALAEAGGVSLGRVPHVLARLEGLGLIRRQGEPRRGRTPRFEILATGETTGAGKISGLRASLLEALQRAAENGDPCPSDRQLAKAAGSTFGSVARALKRLRESGQISVEAVSAQRRRITVTATGKTTAPTVHPSHQAKRARKASASARSTRIDERRQAVEALFVEAAEAGKPAPTRAEIGRRLGTSIDTARLDVRALVKAGRLTPIKAGPRPIYQVAAAGKITGRGDDPVATWQRQAARRPAPIKGGTGVAPSAGAGPLDWQPREDDDEVARLVDKLEAYHAAGRVPGSWRELLEGVRETQASDAYASGRQLLMVARRFRGLESRQRKVWLDAERTVTLPPTPAGSAGPTPKAQHDFAALDAEERKRLEAEFRARGGQVRRCPTAYVAPSSAAAASPAGKRSGSA